jgi:hypothetical protein
MIRSRAAFACSPSTLISGAEAVSLTLAERGLGGKLADHTSLPRGLLGRHVRSRLQPRRDAVRGSQRPDLHLLRHLGQHQHVPLRVLSIGRLFRELHPGRERMYRQRFADMRLDGYVADDSDLSLRVYWRRNLFGHVCTQLSTVLRIDAANVR